MHFQLNRVAPGVTHICDCMGVCMTLIEGEKAALLVDTGYGVESVGEMVRSLIGNKPVSVFLTHHHHDHALGLRTIGNLTDCECSMLPADAPAFEKYTCKARREIVLEQAKARGVQVGDPDRFLNGVIDMPCSAQPGDIDLGGLTARIIECPGHTPGSAAVLVVERKILLTGDCWNPVTWVFFEEALGIREYRRNVRLLQAYDFAHVLCGHSLQMYPRAVYDAFADHLTDDVLRAAQPVRMARYEHLDTRQARVTDDHVLVFDWNKAQL